MAQKTFAEAIKASPKMRWRNENRLIVLGVGPKLKQAIKEKIRRANLPRMTMSKITRQLLLAWVEDRLYIETRRASKPEKVVKTSQNI